MEPPTFYTFSARNANELICSHGVLQREGQVSCEPKYASKFHETKLYHWPKNDITRYILTEYLLV